MDNIRELIAQIRKNPSRPDLHNTLGTAYMQKGNRTEAANHFLTAARMFASTDSSTRNVNKAIAILKRMLRDFPDMQDPYFMLAEIYEEMDNREEAVSIYNILSDLYVAQEKFLMAVSVYDKVIDMAPESLDAWTRFAQLNKSAGMPFHASQGYTRAASLCPETDLAARVDLLVEAVRLDPDNAEPMEVLRRLLEKAAGEEPFVARILDLAESLMAADQAEQVVKLLQYLPGGAATEAVMDLKARAEAITGDDESESEPLIPDRAAGLSGTKVLVVDDEQEILLLLEQILRQEGFKVITASDGEEAMNLFLTEKPPLVVSDAMLPRLHGFELCSRIKEMTDHKVMVMILTAVYKKYKYKGKVQEQYHVDEYLDKPFQITEFLDTFYRMAGSISDEITIHEEAEPEESALFIMAAGAGERDLAVKLEGFCEREGCSYQLYHSAREMFDGIKEKEPDILIITDKLPGMEPSLAVDMLRDIMVLETTTFVQVTRDQSLLDGSAGNFNHRLAAPVSHGTLSTVVKLHQDRRRRSGLRRQEAARSINERRIEAVVRSKVSRVLKNHSHLEEFYNSRIRELQKEIDELKSGHDED